MKKKPLTIAASVLLLINAVGALYGGGNFILHPDGSGMKITLDLLKHTPFNNYLIPGIILVIVNGLFSLIVLISLIGKVDFAPWLVMAQGTILLGWIIIQIIMIQIINFHHIVFISIGIVLIITGWQLKRQIHDKYEEEG